MSAELLRKAAKVMRERAEAATPSPTGWTHGPHFERLRCASVFAGKRTDGHYLAMYATPSNAEHIASWPPLVALAVADLLDKAYREWDTFGVHPDPTLYTVARAYLGKDS